MRWAEIEVATNEQAQDAVSNLLTENGCAGTVIKDAEPLTVTGYLPVDDRLEQRLLEIRSGLNDLPGFGLDAAPGEITVRYAEDQDWAEAWRDFFHATRVGKRIVIKPTWEEFTPERRDIIIEIDPGMAFGTGSHATTKLCLELLERLLKPRVRVVDFGTGTGILAIAAAKMGASLVIAFDDDELAVKAARANVVQNDCEDRIEVHRAASLRFLSTKVEMITANIVAETIMANAEDMAAALTLGGILIASGITKAKTFDVEQSLRNVGFDIKRTVQEGEWVAIAAVKAS